VTFQVTIGDIPVIGGKPVVPTLYALASEVERIIRAIEAETIWLIR
jgi:hypothetical protein